MENGTVWQGTLADYWFDEDGILHGLSKEAPRTVEAVKENSDLVSRITGNKKVCVIIDNTHTRAYDMEALKLLLEEFKNMYKAVAFVPRSSIGKMLSGIYEELNPAGSAPIKVFASTGEAKKWIRKFS